MVTKDNDDNTANYQSHSGDDKPRLTEEEKKHNHIASEQKRRQGIRSGFDRLTELVPGLEGQGRSEGLVLQRTVKYLVEQLEKRKEIVEELEARGETVEEDLKEQLYYLSEWKAKKEETRLKEEAS